MALAICPKDEQTIREGRIKELPSGIIESILSNPMTLTVSFDQNPKIIDNSAFVSLVIVAEELTNGRIYKAQNIEKVETHLTKQQGKLKTHIIERREEQKKIRKEKAEET